mgnify:CR=1 FL=1
MKSRPSYVQYRTLCDGRLGVARRYSPGELRFRRLFPAFVTCGGRLRASWEGKTSPSYRKGVAPKCRLLSQNESRSKSDGERDYDCTILWERGTISRSPKTVWWEGWPELNRRLAA